MYYRFDERLRLRDDDSVTVAAQSSHPIGRPINQRECAGANRPPAGIPAAELVGKRVDEYIASGEWKGKAGGYGIQGRAGAFVENLIGSYTAVVGLPVYETRLLLVGLGYHP